MRDDSDIKRDVETELRWNSDIDATDVGVSVKQGVVTLSGFVRSYSEKFDAERDAKRVSGVVGVANDLEVRLPSSDQRPDPDIARDAVSAVKSQLPFVADRIKVLVDHGWMTLEGEVEWNFQKERAETAVRHIRGVKGVVNQIHIKPRAPVASEVKQKIEEALKRRAELEAEDIKVETKGSEVILRGKVRTWTEREEAERAAWLAPGVTKVDNRISVGLLSALAA